MKFGIHIGHMGGPLDEMRKLWKFADAKGFDWFSVSDHFQESPPRGGDMDCYEAIATLTAAAMDTKKVRRGSGVYCVVYRNPALLAKSLTTIDHLSGGRINVGVGSGWMPEEFAAASAAHIYQKRNKHVRETIEVMQGIWTNELFEYHGEFADFPKCGFGVKPVQKPRPPMFIGGLGKPEIAAARVAKYGLEGWIGIMDTPEAITTWRAAIKAEFEKLGSKHALDALEISSMLPFEITRDKTDQTPRGKLTPTLVGTADQITDNLKRYRDAGMTMPLLWPPFSGTPTAKTIVDMRRLVHDILPKV